MQYYPVSLDIKNKKCLVVGGGRVGTRKVRTLIKCFGIVSVISDEFSQDLKNMAQKEEVTLLDKKYNADDLKGMFLVIGATDDVDLNKSISRDAHKRNMLCNIADFPEACNFILPSIVERGDMTLSISTSGKSPAFAKKIRRDLEKQFGDEYAAFLVLMGQIRKILLAEKHEPEEHKTLFENIIKHDIPGFIKSGKTDRINEVLRDVLGDGFDYHKLTGTL